MAEKKPLYTITVEQYAYLEGKTARAIQVRCEEGKMKAVKLGGQWRIHIQEYNKLRYLLGVS